MEQNLLKAYEDIPFLKRNDLRPVRLQLELLKPELIMNDEGVRSTIVIFGSARTLAPDEANRRLQDARQHSNTSPDNPHLRSLVARAEQLVHHSQYYALAREFAAQISQLGQAHGLLDYVVTTGGGPGIMEAANRGAHDVGAKSIGLNITLPHEQHSNPYITPELNFLFHYFSIRKMHFLLRAKALCAFPGGYGTMDELFETLTLVQTYKTPRIPIILFGREFWETLVNWQSFVEWGMISEEDLSLFTFADTAEEGVRQVVSYYESRPR